MKQFTDLLTLMAVDDNIDEQELKHIKSIGEKYQLTERTIEEMINRFR